MERTWRFRHSIADWCLRHTGPKLLSSEILALALKLGVDIDLAPQEDWKEISTAGVSLSTVLPTMGSMAPFEPGFANKDQWGEVEARIVENLDLAADWQIPNVIIFTGYQPEMLHKDVAYQNVLDGLRRRVVSHAELKNVTLCIEMLNTVGTEAGMLGHPLYLGDETDRVLEIVQKIKSPRLKLAFDIYHQAMMGEEILANVRKCAGNIGVVHTAGKGNPQRCALHHEGQEIDYAKVMDAIGETGFSGTVVHEFNYYAGDDAEMSLRRAIEICEGVVV